MYSIKSVFFSGPNIFDTTCISDAVFPKSSDNILSLDFGKTASEMHVVSKIFGPEKKTDLIEYTLEK